MIAAKLVFDTLILPALVLGATFWTLRKFVGSSPLLISLAPAVALAAGYMIGHYRVAGFPQFFPSQTTGWLFYLVGLAVPAAAAARKWKPASVGILIVLLVVATLKPMWTFHWPFGQSLLWFAGLWTALFLLWYVLDRLAFAARGALLSFAFCWAALASGVVLALSATALLGQLSVILAVCLGGLSLIAAFSKTPSEGWIVVAITALAGLLLNGLFYAQLSGWNAAFLALAVPAAWAARLPFAQRRGPRQSFAVGMLAVILATAPPIADAGLSFLNEPDYDYDYDDYGE